MKTSLLFRYLRLKTTFLNKLSETSDDCLTFRPDKTSWSVVQICEHLMKVEETVYQSFKKQKELPLSSRHYQWKNVWKFFLLKLALISRLKFKVPSPKVTPISEKTFEEVKASWIQLSLSWENQIESLDSESGTIFRHPSTGWLTANQTFQFMIDHLNHHQPQIDYNRRLFYQAKSKT